MVEALDGADDEGAVRPGAGECGVEVEAAERGDGGGGEGEGGDGA